MAQAIKESPSPGVRVAMIQSLAEVYDYTAMPPMLELLEDPDPAVAGKAAAAVQHMLGLRYNAEDIAIKRSWPRWPDETGRCCKALPTLSFGKKHSANGNRIRPADPAVSQPNIPRYHILLK